MALKLLAKAPAEQQESLGCRAGAGPRDGAWGVRLVSQRRPQSRPVQDTCGSTCRDPAGKKRADILAQRYVLTFLDEMTFLFPKTA